MVAPVLVRVSVNEPDWQSAQAVCECALNLPAALAVQVCAPALLSVSVTDPSAHDEHWVIPAAAAYVPAAQAVQPPVYSPTLL